MKRELLSMSELLSRFPMQDGPSIDWQAAQEVYKIYSCLYGTDQSCVRLAERGGFGWGEIPLFLKKHAEKRRRGQCGCDSRW